MCIIQPRSWLQYPNKCSALMFCDVKSFNIISQTASNWCFFVQFDAEFRRFGLPRDGLPTYDEFLHLLEEIHKLNGSSFTVAYTDPEGDLLPISNNENFAKALTTAKPLLRVFIHRKGEHLLF